MLLLSIIRCPHVKRKPYLSQLLYSLYVLKNLQLFLYIIVIYIYTYTHNYNGNRHDTNWHQEKCFKILTAVQISSILETSWGSETFSIYSEWNIFTVPLYSIKVHMLKMCCCVHKYTILLPVNKIKIKHYSNFMKMYQWIFHTLTTQGPMTLTLGTGGNIMTPLPTLQISIYAESFKMKWNALTQWTFWHRFWVYKNCYISWDIFTISWV